MDIKSMQNSSPNSLDTAHEFRPTLPEPERAPAAVSAEEKLKIAVEALQNIHDESFLKHATHNQWGEQYNNWIPWARQRARDALARIAPDGGV